MKKYTPKRILAIISIVLIVAMVFATLIAAVFDKSGLLFRSFLIVTVALPLALWIFIWAYGAMTDKHTIASFDLMSINDTEDQTEGDNDAETDKQD